MTLGEVTDIEWIDEFTEARWQLRPRARTNLRPNYRQEVHNNFGLTTESQYQTGF